MTGRHVSVLLEEAVAALGIRPDGTYVDATFGRGGHSRRVLELLGPAGRLVALDRDPAAQAAAREIADARFRFVRARFGELQQALAEAGVNEVDGVLFDLGVSSPQIEDATRGMSFRLEGPLDMRMDPERGESASDWLARAAEEEIREVIATYGEERFARQIARAIATRRGLEPIASTRELAQLVASAVRTREPGQDPATRTFQAVRIFINRELEELSLALPQAVKALIAGGRLAVISFHSLEDRMVKRFLAEQARGPEVPRGLPLRAAELPAPVLRLVGRAMRPKTSEVAANPRARSAILRVAEKLPA